jgi:hypothetical protein
MKLPLARFRHASQQFILLEDRLDFLRGGHASLP